MPRIYNVNFSAVTVAAAQDLVQITGATGKMMRILRAWLAPAQTSLPTGQAHALRARYLPATVTVGSGGTTGITPSKNEAGDAACSSTTCATNNTTPATSNGTVIVLWAGGCHHFQGIEQVFNSPPVGPSTAFVWELLSTPSGTVVLSGGVQFEEIG